LANTPRAFKFLLGTNDYLSLCCTARRKTQDSSIHTICHQETSISGINAKACGHIQLAETFTSNAIRRASNCGTRCLTRRETLNPMVAGVCDIQVALAIESYATREAQLLWRTARRIGLANEDFGSSNIWLVAKHAMTPSVANDNIPI
jgi:hypothetical protein